MSQSRARFKRNDVAMKCLACQQDVELGTGVLPSSFPTECYHEECQRLHVLTSYPCIPMSAPDSSFKVGILLRQCACGSKYIALKDAEVAPAQGSQFWIECCDCGAMSRAQAYRAHAAVAWNALPRLAVQERTK